MKKNFKNHAVVGVCALGLIGLNSCQVDDAYDLDKEIDKTITVGGDLTIPGSNTDNMMLKDLLEIEDGSAVVTDEEGNYILQQAGSSNSTEIDIPGVTISTAGGFSGVEVDGVSNPGGSNITIPDNTSIGIDENIAIDINSDGITSVLKELVSANTNCVGTKVVVRLSKTGYADISAKMSDFKVEFPEFMTIETQDENWEVTEGRILTLKNEGSSFSESVEIPVNITKIDFEKNGAEYIYNSNVKDNNVISLNGGIVLKGDIALEGSMGSGASVSLKIDVESESIDVNKVTAVVDPEVDIEIDDMNITDIPDFLNDENVAIELTDPRLFFTVTNPSPIEVKFGAVLTPVKTGMDNLESVQIKDITIPAGCSNYVICIHQNAGMDGDIQADSKVVVENLNSIIRNIPEKIQVSNVEVKLPEEAISIETGKHYDLATAYEVKTPLMFSEGTEIVYTETMDGWGSDLEDIEFNTVEATMTVDNQLPLGVKIDAVAVDNAGNALSNVNVDINMDIKAGAKSDVNITVSTTDGSIKGLDGLKLTVTATGSGETSGVCLNENQYIKIDNLKLKLKGGITMEL